MLMLIILICLIGIIILYELYETGSLQRCEYSIPCTMLKSAITIVVFADVHRYSKHRSCSVLAEKIADENPDLVLVPGDMITKNQRDTWSSSAQLMRQIAGKSTVLCSLGNHEAAMQMKHAEDPAAVRFFKTLREAGVRVLDNETVCLNISGQEISVSGLTLDRRFFERVHAPVPTEQDVEEKLGKSGVSGYSILLAHTPAGSEAYDRWGADLTLSGHYHGGVVRIGKWGLITPQLKFFTDHAHGIFRTEDRYMVVTSGLGVHAIPFRVFNRPEYVVIHLEPVQES